MSNLLMHSVSVRIGREYFWYQVTGFTVCKILSKWTS